MDTRIQRYLGNGIGNGIGNETELFSNNYDFFPVPLQFFGLRDQPSLIRFHALQTVTERYHALLNVTNVNESYKEFLFRIYLALPKLDFLDFKLNISKLLINYKILLLFNFCVLACMMELD